MNLKRYAEALSDPSSGLTYPAFVGAQKQSVTDAERPFSPRLADFMDANGYHYEAQYIKQCGIGEELAMSVVCLV